MTRHDLTKTTDTIPFIDISGNVLKEIQLPEKIMPVPSKRTGMGVSGLYYKGAGTIYVCHFTNERDNGTRLISKTGIMYEEYKVCHLNLVGRYGIFNFRHQPVFSDLEGGCGRKEESLVKMQQAFELSAISEIVDIIPTGIKDGNIYVYRRKEVSGSLNDTVNLIEYFLTHDFCTAWDKNLWADIYNYGYIRDVGDWFISDKIGCKIGTMYALLHSLYEADIYSYCELIKLITGTFNSERHFIIYYSALCVRKFCPHLFEASDPDMDEITPDLFGFLLIKMFEGKACCHLEDESAWNWVRDKYMERVDSYKQKISNVLQYL